MSSRQSLWALAALALAASPAFAAGPLFPTPLHLTREVDEPLTGRTFVVEEYFVGNRTISIHGGRVAVADYAKGEMIRIDRESGTWSTTSFEAIARANAVSRPRAASAAPRSRDPEVRFSGREQRRGRAVEVFRAEAGDTRRIEITVDRAVALSAGAAEIIIGCAYPFERSRDAEVLLVASQGGDVAAAGALSGWRAHALPIEIIVVEKAPDGSEIRSASRVVRIGSELPPSDLLLIPPGARRVEDERVAAARLLDALDRLPSELSPENP